jgi:DNA-binding MarR family transcriptional regulator
MKKEDLQEIHWLLHRLRSLHLKMCGSQAGKCMSEGQGQVMRCLYYHPHTVQSQLAARLAIRPASLSELLGKLEKNGYLRREKSAADRRVVELTLTPAGRERYMEQHQHHDRHIEELFAVLSEQEIGQLESILRKLVLAGAKRLHVPVDDSPCGHCEYCHHHFLAR